MIVFALLGVLAFLAVGPSHEKTLGESIDEATEEISNKMGDHTRQ